MQISLTDSYSTQEVQVQVILTEESLTCADARLSNDLLLNVIKKKKKSIIRHVRLHLLPHFPFLRLIYRQPQSTHAMNK